MNITKPIIRKIKDNETALAEFEKEIKINEAEDTKDIIMNFPTVYIHNWPETNKYDVYVGESNNIFARTRQHYQSRIKHETWQYRMMKTDASLYIIGHEHFNKSMTLDVENRLMHYLMSVDKVHQVHNGRGNPQKHYYPSAEFEEIFRKIWTELHESDEELFPDENIVKDSAIYKASPLHKLTDEQENAKIQILECIDLARQKHEKQIIFIDGEAGTGKTVLNSNIFYELYCQEEEKDNAEFKCCMVVNHDEQVKVYSDIAKKLGITEKYKDVVSKASTFLNRHKDPDSVDVVFVDEAHLLFTQGNQGYSGKNQLDDIVKRAKVVVIVFDENQILRMDQYWEKQMIDRYRNKAIEQRNHITLTKPEIYTDNYNSLEEWIELRKRNEEFVYPQFFVPFREWMKDIEQKSDMEIKELLRILLQPYTLGVDTVDTYEFYKEYVQDKVNKEKNLQTYELCMNQLKYNERIYRIKNKQEAWEGLTWVLPLLNINPMKALKALGMYFDAECIYMPDDRIYGISDAMDIIEEKYIKSASDKNAYIFSLTSREFEILIAILYEALGYKVNLTKATRDGGKDIIAEINENERKEKVFVECKLYKTCELKKETVRALGYTMLSEEATRAVIFTSGYATKALKEMDTRIQIFDMEEMILLLNANLGERWYADFERLKSNFVKN